MHCPLVPSVNSLVISRAKFSVGVWFVFCSFMSCPSILKRSFCLYFPSSLPSSFLLSLFARRGCRVWRLFRYSSYDIRCKHSLLKHFIIVSLGQDKIITIITTRDFPGGAVVKNLPANAGDTGSSPGPGGSHMLQSN